LEDAANDVSSRKAISLEQCREPVGELDAAGWGKLLRRKIKGILVWQYVSGGSG
jgi:hypothetical protein